MYRFPCTRQCNGYFPLQNTTCQLAGLRASSWELGAGSWELGRCDDKSPPVPAEYCTNLRCPILHKPHCSGLVEACDDFRPTETLRVQNWTVTDGR